ncbi:MAG: DUF4097 family beta strand repeat-containing protein [Imperialibacter sp.]|uniref:DUF4097 family beta strand repeat-containing protein n=1 Tax=Imperialibacter sp. TaxID=2038411 RepID=UPI003A83E19A
MKLLNKPGLTVALLFMVAGMATAQQKVDRTFSGINKVTMSISSGDAFFEKSADGKVYVALEHDIDDYEPTIEQKGSTLVINEEKMKNRRSWSGDSKWTIKVPDEVNISFNTGSGDVQISGLMADLSTNSGSGNTRIENSNGKIRVNTGSGNIRARESKGELSFNAGSGNIDLYSVDAEVSANVGSGNVSVEKLKLSGRSSFNSGSGDVEVSLAATPAYDISVNSGSGDSTLDFEGNKIEGVIVMEANKNNGDIDAPFDFDSTEEIGNGRNTTVKKTKKMGSSDVRIKVSTGSGTAEIKS